MATEPNQDFEKEYVARDGKTYERAPARPDPGQCNHCKGCAFQNSGECFASPDCMIGPNGEHDMQSIWVLKQA